MPFSFNWGGVSVIAKSYNFVGASPVPGVPEMKSTNRPGGIGSCVGAFLIQFRAVGGRVAAARFCPGIS